MHQSKLIITTFNVPMPWSTAILSCNSSPILPSLSWRLSQSTHWVPLRGHPWLTPLGPTWRVVVGFFHGRTMEGEDRPGGWLNCDLSTSRRLVDPLWGANSGLEPCGLLWRGPDPQASPFFLLLGIGGTSTLDRHGSSRTLLQGQN